MTKKEFKNLANNKLHVIKQAHDLFVTLLSEGIEDICKAQQGKQFKFEETVCFRVPDPYDNGEWALILSVYYNGDEVRVRYLNEETGTNDEAPIYRFSYATQYTIANSIAQATFGNGYRGEWC